MKVGDALDISFVNHAVTRSGSSGDLSTSPRRAPRERHRRDRTVPIEIWRTEAAWSQVSSSTAIRASISRCSSLRRSNARWTAARLYGEVVINRRDHAVIGGRQIRRERAQLAVRPDRRCAGASSGGCGVLRRMAACRFWKSEVKILTLGVIRATEAARDLCEGGGAYGETIQPPRIRAPHSDASRRALSDPSRNGPLLNDSSLRVSRRHLSLAGRLDGGDGTSVP
jgi:hypothetical protein